MSGTERNTMSNLNTYVKEFLEKEIPDSPLNEWLQDEVLRQDNGVELIASENYPSEKVRIAMASCLSAKYCEGYPEMPERSGRNGRYYGGCQNIDKIEQYCCETWQKVFNTDYHVNVQPHSGSQANQAAYAAILSQGDTVLSLDLNHGGHLTHGSSVNFSGKTYNFIFYNVDDFGYVSLDDIYNKLLETRPALVLVGASAYPRIFDFPAIKAVIDKAWEEIVKTDENYKKPYFMVDMAHIAGLVASGDHPTPFGYADIVTTTTHKTLRGPRGGMIFCRKGLAKKVDGALFPGCQGGPLEHVILAKAICAEEDCTDAYHEYCHQVVKNCKAMADEFIRLGYDLVTGGTDNHLLLLDLTKTGISGKALQDELDLHGITLNKNMVPNDPRSPKETSGVRIGTAPMTTRGYKEADFIAVAQKIDAVIKEMQAGV